MKALVTYIPQSLPPNTLYIIDGTSLIYKSYYSKENEKSARSLTKGDVDCTALGIMLNRLCRFINSVGPNSVVLAFDTNRDTVRRQLYAEYKATRSQVGFVFVCVSSFH